MALAFGWCPPVFAAPFKDAIVNHAVNDVRVAEVGKPAHTATTHAIVHDGSAVFTGVRSRAELLFPDRTMTRLGAETSLRFQPGTRDLLLDRGTLLLQIPRFHGGARIRLGSLTATAGRATVIIEHLPGASVKICVIEGDLRISADGFLGDSLVLTPGKMVITTPDARRIPDPVDVDLRTLTTTSTLINPVVFQSSSNATAAVLPSQSQIVREIGRQGALIKGKTLFPTNLAIVGSGTSVIIPGSDRLQDRSTGNIANSRSESEAAARPQFAAAPRESGRGPEDEAERPIP